MASSILHSLRKIFRSPRPNNNNNDVVEDDSAAHANDGTAAVFALREESRSARRRRRSRLRRGGGPSGGRNNDDENGNGDEEDEEGMYNTQPPEDPPGVGEEGGSRNSNENNNPPTSSASRGRGREMTTMTRSERRRRRSLARRIAAGGGVGRTDDDDDDDEDDEEDDDGEGNATDNGANNNGALIGEEAEDTLATFFGIAQTDVGQGKEIKSLASLRLIKEDGGEINVRTWNNARKEVLQKFLTHRFLLEDENVICNEDDVSFNSDIFDEPFPSETLVTGTTSHFNNYDTDDDDEDDEEQLQTQPQTAVMKDVSFDMEEEDNDDEEESTQLLLGTQPIPTTTTTTKGGIFSGIKRKLGFYTTSTQQQQQHPSSQKKQRTNHSKQSSSSNSSKHRGAMWDGRVQSIPHVDNTTKPCTRLSNLDLETSALDLSLCQILRVWGIRSTKRMDKLMAHSQNDNDGGVAESTTEILHPSQAMMPYGNCEDDGPLNTIYERVYSIEVCQLDNDSDGSNINTAISNMTTSAFHDGIDQLAKETSRKRRHNVQRVRIFFYNQYAKTVALAVKHLQDESATNTKKKKNPSLLLSLANIPPECILPQTIAPNGIHSHLQQYVVNPYGNETTGVLSPYCICIGDKSSLSYTDNEKFYFGRRTLEIRLTEVPSKFPLADIGNNNEENKFVEDFVIVATKITRNKQECGVRSYMDESILVKRYVDLQASRAGDGPRAMLINVEDDNVAGGCGVRVSNPGMAGLRGSMTTTASTAQGNNGTNPSTKSLASGLGNNNTNAEASASDDPDLFRPTSAVSLQDLRGLLQQKPFVSKQTVTVWAIVLGFTPPALTSTREWKMAIVLIDESLSLSSTTQGQSTNANGNVAEMHVPSVTLMLFSKDKSKLPIVRSAGDVILCDNVSLQSWNGEAQLMSNKGVSKLVIIRPSQARTPDNPSLPNSILPDGWSSIGDRLGSIQYPYVNNLWLWGQQRLAAHPTMSPNCYLSIGGVGDSNNSNVETSVSGDLTAAVTAIIPMPENLRHRDTPRGFIRLWDGTGPSRSDPLPLDESIIGMSQPHDPPEKVLVEIEKILACMSSSSGHRVVEAPITLCGRVINAVIWEEELWNLIHREAIVQIGSFIRLRNVNNSKLASGLCNCLSVHARSSLTPLPFDTYEVKRLLKGHHSCLRRGVPHNPRSALLPARLITEQLRNNGFTTIAACLQRTTPALVTVQFEVINTIPVCDLSCNDAMKVLCRTSKDGSPCFQFALHVKDASGEIDIMCMGKIADDILGITARDISEKPEACEKAVNALNELMLPGSICEGKIRSIVAKDGKIYFVLQSIVCIPADDEVV